MAPTFAVMERKSIKSEFPVDTSPVIVLVTSVLLALTTVAVILRCYTRIFLQKKFTIDDYLIVFSQACFATLSALTYVGVEFGAGKHAIYIVLNNPEHLHEISMVCCFHASFAAQKWSRCDVMFYKGLGTNS